MDPVISVIVPVYCSENYLWSCLDSLAAQTQEGIEILLVDDGSTDRSGEICDQYARSDPRFRAFHTENRGSGAARNYGIDRSRGEYLMFVDSDDWVERDFCLTALRCAREQEADMVVFSAAASGGGPSEIVVLPPPVPGLQTLEDAMAHCLHGTWTMPWNKLYARELFDGVRFVEGRLFEDIGTLHKLIWNARRIWYTDRTLYHYRLRRASTSHKKSPRQRTDIFLMSLQRALDLQSRGYEPEAMEAWAVKYSLRYCMREGDPDPDARELALRTVKESSCVPADLTGEEREMLEKLRG